MSEAELRKRIMRIALLLGAAAAAVALSFARGLIPLRFLAWIFIAEAAIGYLAFYRLLRRVQKERHSAPQSATPLDESTRTHFRRQILFLKVALAFLLCCLVYGLWSSRGAPFLPRITGATMNIVIEFVLISAILRLQRKLG
jgi:Trk-type K+ transport system membrane component